MQLCKIGTGWNLLPVLIHIVRRHKPLLLSTWLGVLFLIILKKLRFLLEVHALTQAARSYVLSISIHFAYSLSTNVALLLLNS